MNTQTYFKLPWVPEKENEDQRYRQSAGEFNFGKKVGFNLGVDTTAKKDWYLDEEEIKNIINKPPLCCGACGDPEWYPPSMGLDNLVKAIAAAGPRVLKVRKT